MDFHVEAERWLQSCLERLYALRLRERADARKQRLEAVLVLRYRARPLARHQLTKGVGADRRPKAEVEELGEAAPRRYPPPAALGGTTSGRRLQGCMTPSKLAPRLQYAVDENTTHIG